MFTGIVEGVFPILRVAEGASSVQIWIQRPEFFDDLKIGDSIAVNGVCLTVEKFNDREMQFSLGAETLRLVGWTATSLQNQKMNLERSLRFGDRVHGHLVTGHVEAVGSVRLAHGTDESWFVDVEFPPRLRPYLWDKGSVTINGVSLTVNVITGNRLSVCLIPETLKRTHLGSLKVGDSVNLETDYMAKAVLNFKNHSEFPMGEKP